MSSATEAALESRVAHLEQALCLMKEERDAAVKEKEEMAREKEEMAREKDAVIEALAARLSKLEAAAGASDGYHNGPNSPSSSGSMSSRKRAKKEADRRAERGIKKPGRQKGHPGVTRKIRADRTVHHRPERCGRCGSSDLHETSVKSKQTVELARVVIRETNHVMHDCRCLECGSDVEAPRGGTVKGTSMGPVLASAVGCLWKHGCSIGSIRGVLKDVFGVDACRASVHRSVTAVADALAEEDAMIRRRAGDRGDPGGDDETGYGHTYRNEPLSDAPGRDEPEAGPGPPAGAGPQRAVPSMVGPPDPVGGCDARRQVYAWGSVTAWCTVIRLFASRGAAVFYEHFADRIGRANTTDGYSVYNAILIRQRCAAHVIRPAEQISWSGDPMDVYLHRRLLDLFRLSKDLAHPGGALADPRARENHEMLAASAWTLAGEYRDAGHAKFAGTLERASGQLFTFILHPGLEPTNNACERAMRAVVKHRNVRQQCTTAGGRARFGILLTCFETWGKQGLSAMDRMCEILGATPSPEYARIRAAGPRVGIGRT